MHRDGWVFESAKLKVAENCCRFVFNEPEFILLIIKNNHIVCIDVHPFVDSKINLGPDLRFINNVNQEITILTQLMIDLEVDGFLPACKNN